MLTVLVVKELQTEVLNIWQLQAKTRITRKEGKRESNASFGANISPSKAKAAALKYE